MRDLGPALSALPLFPLPTVLFPGALLPLHVFEPRYRAMIRDAIETHQALAVVLITDSTTRDKQGNPAIAKVAGAGIIIDHTELPSGRYNILVRGRARVRLEELPFVEPYRRAAATVLEPPHVEVPQGDLSALLSAASGFAARVREREPNFDFTLPKDAPASVITDLCAHYLVLDARERQTILETLDPVARARRAAEALVVQRVTLSNEPRDMN
jgi:Lon protease-like protein